MKGRGGLEIWSEVRGLRRAGFRWVGEMSTGMGVDICVLYAVEYHVEYSVGRKMWTVIDGSADRGAEVIRVLCACD